MLAGVAAFAQTEGDVPFNGLIINEAGKGVSRFKVKVKGARAHTLSDNQGRFGLTNVPGDAVLQFSYKKIESNLYSVTMLSRTIVSGMQSQVLHDCSIHTNIATHIAATMVRMMWSILILQVLIALGILVCSHSSLPLLS
jgi:hypothetical protein